MCVCMYACRPVATGGGEGGSAPPLEKFEPPRLPVPFAVTIGIEVPPGILSAPLLTIPGYGAVCVYGCVYVFMYLAGREHTAS